MSHNPEIPCTSCHRWSIGEKKFSCNPSKCQKLSEWLLDHTQIETPDPVKMQIVDTPIQYVV